jgi:hypothetical protein
MGRTATELCTVGTVDPNRLRFCATSPAFLAQNQYKLVLAYPLPYGIRVSGTFVSVPGPANTANNQFPVPGVVANYTLTSALAGITLTNGSIVVPLIEPGSLFGERKNQVDLRLGKTVRPAASSSRLRWTFTTCECVDRAVGELYLRTGLAAANDVLTVGSSRPWCK